MKQLVPKALDKLFFQPISTDFKTPKYLDKTKYRGRGRPRKADYTECEPLFNQHIKNV